MFPPELRPGEFNESQQLPDGLSKGLNNAWDVSVRYHEFKNRAIAVDRANQLRKISANAILSRAKEILGSIVHPSEQRVLPWEEIPPGATLLDLDIEETLENTSGLAAHALIDPHNIWMTYRVHRTQPMVLSVDTSLSMTGEKLALTAVALAVVLLQFPDDPIGVIAFENSAKVLKYPEEKISIQEFIERFLDVPAQGYTHLEDGLLGSLRLVKKASVSGRMPSTVLLTDGKYTAGRDPAYLAQRFPHLIVLKMGDERASLELCREMAKKGKGFLREVGDLSELPVIMYKVVKELLRGRSV